MEERLQKWLAARGLGSRRQAEEWIRAGRVCVDGKPATLGQKVTGHEQISFDGRLVRAADPAVQRPRTLVYHKPAGEICTRSDPEGRRTVFDALPRLRGQRWVGVGRLDVQTSGLLIFTTDGELANRLMHPGTGVEREYAIRVQGELDDQALRKLRNGIELDDGRVQFRRFQYDGGDAANRWYRGVLAEGRNRVVRRAIEAVGGRVSRLIRVRFGPMALPRDLPRGRHRELRPGELRDLYRVAGLPAPEHIRPRRNAFDRRRRRG